jgi:hypothetical protein
MAEAGIGGELCTRYGLCKGFRLTRTDDTILRPSDAEGGDTNTSKLLGCIVV